MKYRLKIKRDGTLEFLGEPPPKLVLPGVTTRQRFSEIVPVYGPLRLVFRALRFLFGEQGSVAEWTRQWECEWLCLILIGPMRGAWATCNNRQLLVDWEQALWKLKGTLRR